MHCWKRSLAGLATSALVMGAAACGCDRPARPETPSVAARAASSGSTKETTMTDESIVAAERLLAAMEAAFARNDVEGLVALFAPDATIESYLVSAVFHRKEAVCRGTAEIREFVRALMQRGVPWGGHEPPLVRGNTIAVEFRSPSSDAEKFSVDIIELKDGKVESLRAYAGWRAMARAAQARSGG